MYIRFEKIPRKGEIVSIIDETNKYLGDIDTINLCDCINIDKTFEEDGYTFFFADKKQLTEKLIK